MNHTQKTAKYLALALALFLSIVIFSGLVKAVWIGFRFLYGQEAFSRQQEFVSREYRFSDVDALSVENAAGELVIRSGSEFKVETCGVDESITCNVENGTLVILQKADWESWWGMLDRVPQIIVTVPEGVVLTKAEIENKAGSLTVSGISAGEMTIRSGAGEVSLEKIESERFDLSNGAGKITGKQIDSKATIIKGRAGELSLSDCRLSNLTLDGGVGKTAVSGEITGNSTIKCGVGETRLQINGKKEEYRLSVHSSIGSVKVNGSDYSSSDREEEDAPNKLNISGGVGKISVDFQN